MNTFWNIAYVNSTTLGPGEYEPVQFPARLLASGSQSVIKNGLRVFITDVKIRSVSDPLGIDPSAGLFMAENGNPIEWTVVSFNAREGWHPNSPILIEGDESVQREMLLVCASLSGAPDRFIVQMSGYVEG